MWRIFFVLVVPIIAFATPVDSQSLRVRSGEHIGFTRLVLQFDARPTWMAGRIERGYGIRFQESEGFQSDLSDVFRLITRDRVASIKANKIEGGIDIVLACDCVAEFVNYRNNAIIVDIAQGPPSTDNQYEDWLISAGAQPDVLDFLIEIAAPEVRANAGFWGRRWKSVDNSETRAASPIDFPKPPLPEKAPSSPRMITVRDSALDAKVADDGVSHAFGPSPVSILSSELSRAIAQGLVSAADAPLQYNSQSYDGLSLSNLRSANMSVVTGVDRDLGVSRPEMTANFSGQSCISDASVDVGGWGDLKDISMLGDLRAAALAENGTLTQSGTLGLARFYIYLGFGAEAAVLAGLLDNPADAALISALAEILDVGNARQYDLTSQLVCDGSIALWAALSRPYLEGDAPQDNSAILQAFAALPQHLRSHLGPTLSERFRNTGAVSDARTALNIARRGGNGTPAHELTEARIGLEGTGAERARKSLLELSRGTDVTAAHALLELFEDAKLKNFVPDPSWVDDAPSLIRATRGTNVAEDLNVAMLNAMVTLARYGEAYKILLETSPGVTPIVQSEIAGRAVLAAALEASTPIFLRTETGFRLLVGINHLSHTDRLIIASRLSETGLHDLALTYLPTDLPIDNDRIKAARILSRAGRDSEAKKFIASVTSAEGISIRPEILARGGASSAAVEAFFAAGEVGSATQLSVQLGDWQWIANSGSPEVAEAVKGVQGAEESDTSKKNENSNGELLISAGQTRSAAVRLLSTLVPSPTTPALTE